MSDRSTGGHSGNRAVQVTASVSRDRVTLRSEYREWPENTMGGPKAKDVRVVVLRVTQDPTQTDLTVLCSLMAHYILRGKQRPSARLPWAEWYEVGKNGVHIVQATLDSPSGTAPAKRSASPDGDHRGDDDDLDPLGTPPLPGLTEHDTVILPPSGEHKTARAQRAPKRSSGTRPAASRALRRDGEDKGS